MTQTVGAKKKEKKKNECSVTISGGQTIRPLLDLSVASSQRLGCSYKWSKHGWTQSKGTTCSS
jgi:hypothetical protein